jgi:hypothetical protein
MAVRRRRADRVTGPDPAMSEDRRQPIASQTGERHLPSSVLDRYGVADIKVGDRWPVFKCLHWLLRGCPQSVHIRATLRHVFPYLASSGGDNLERQKPLVPLENPTISRAICCGRYWTRTNDHRLQGRTSKRRKPLQRLTRWSCQAPRCPLAPILDVVSVVGVLEFVKTPF